MAGCPSVPTKTQRVLINKRQGASSTKTANRLFKRPLASAGQSTMSMNTAASFTSFAKKSASSIKPPFGSKDLRFDGKLELKEYFNKEPGPGCYSEK